MHRRNPFQRKRPRIDTMLLQRHQMFIRHPDRRLIIVSVKRNKTYINVWNADGEGDVIAVMRIDHHTAFDGYGWDLRQLAHILDGAIGRICPICRRELSGGKTFCSNACRQASYRARKG